MNDDDILDLIGDYSPNVKPMGEFKLKPSEKEPRPAAPAPTDPASVIESLLNPKGNRKQ